MSKSTLSTEVRRHLFVCVKFVVDLISKHAPSQNWEGGVVATRENKADEKGRSVLRVKRGVGQFRIMGGSTAAFKAAITSALASALRAEDAGKVLEGKIPEEFKDQAAGIVAEAWTPEIKSAFAYLILDKQADGLAVAPLTASALKVEGSAPIVLRSKTVGSESQQKAIVSALNTKVHGKCPTCGATFSELVTKPEAVEGIVKAQAEAVKAAKAAEKAAKAPKVETLTPKAPKAPKVTKAA